MTHLTLKDREAVGRLTAAEQYIKRTMIAERPTEPIQIPGVIVRTVGYCIGFLIVAALYVGCAGVVIYSVVQVVKWAWVN